MARRPPHFKTMISIKNHDKMREVYGDNRLFALWHRLGIEAVARFADRTGDTFIVHDRELPGLTGLGRADVARTSLERLADVSPISATREGDVWRITFPNFAEKQGFGPKKGNETGEKGVPPSSSASSSFKKEEPEPHDVDQSRAGPGPGSLGGMTGSEGTVGGVNARDITVSDLTDAARFRELHRQAVDLGWGWSGSDGFLALLALREYCRRKRGPKFDALKVFAFCLRTETKRSTRADRAAAAQALASYFDAPKEPPKRPSVKTATQTVADVIARELERIHS